MNLGKYFFDNPTGEGATSEVLAYQNWADMLFFTRCVFFITLPGNENLIYPLTQSGRQWSCMRPPFAPRFKKIEFRLFLGTMSLRFGIASGESPLK